MSTTTDGYPIAGQRYSISCVILFPEGLVSPIVVEWYDSNGLLSDDNEITVGEALISQANITSVLDFNPFRTVHRGRFSCRTTIMSQSPPFNIVKSSEVDIVPGGEFTCRNT